MKYTSVKSPVYSDSSGDRVDCIVEFDGVGEVPFTASYNDDVGHGVDIYNECVNGDYGEVGAYTAPPAIVPAVVTIMQARLALNAAGLLSSVELSINGLDEPRKTNALIEWEYASSVERGSVFTAMLAGLLSLSDVDLDDLFVNAAKL